MLKCFNVKMNKAMTLIEVLTVIAIMLILMAAVFINPRPSVELDNAARQLAADLRRAQNMAMSAQEQGGEVPCGYGICIPGSFSNIREYILFADKDHDCDPAQRDYFWDLAEGDENIEEPDLPSGVVFVPQEDENNFMIIFNSPHADIFISKGLIIKENPFSLPNTTIVLKTEGGICPQDCRYVTVTSAGKIEIE